MGLDVHQLFLGGIVGFVGNVIPRDLQWLHRNSQNGITMSYRNFYQNSEWEMSGFWRFWTYPLVLLDHVKNQYTYQPLSWHDLTDKSWEFKSWQSLWIEHSFLCGPDRFANWTDRRAKESSRYDAVSTVLHSASQDEYLWESELCHNTAQQASLDGIGAKVCKNQRYQRNVRKEH